MENTRSYMSRFSGLGLFILAVAVVGLLVWLTVRSADNNSNTSVTGADIEQQENNENGDDQAAVGGEANNENENAATTDDETDDDEFVAGSSDDELATDNLPETGAESVLLPTLALSLITWAVAEKQRLAKISIQS